MYKARFYHPHKAVRAVAIAGLTGLCAGVVNGLLGAGGGIIAVLVLGAWQKHHAATADAASAGDARDVYAASLLAMLPVSLLSALQYTAQGQLTYAAFSPYLLPALAGGVIGGLALDRVRLPFLRRLFAILLLVSGARMLFG
ncbi:MAG: sulfite exporter TauE/SafE family protein [Clostridia bacterium]|nr:sulfite exporter TauE/SafE family protein [Clostridia bacterium]